MTNYNIIKNATSINRENVFATFAKEWAKETAEWFSENENKENNGMCFSCFPFEFIGYGYMELIINALNETEWADRYTINNRNQVFARF